MKEKIIPVFVPSLLDEIEDPETAEKMAGALSATIKLLAIGTMHAIEAESMEIMGDINRLVFMRFTNPKDPGFIDDSDITKAVMLMAIGVHSHLTKGCSRGNHSEEAEIMSTPIDQLFPEIKDLPGKKGDQQ